MRIWTTAVANAVRRHVAHTGSPEFTRQDLIAAELNTIKAETQTRGITPTQTMTRELQYLRRDGLVEFVAPGRYRWLGEVPELAPAVPSNAVFVLDTLSGSGEMPEQAYRFELASLSAVRRTVGQWIVYQGAQGYYAAAQVERIDPDRNGATMPRALIAERSYVEFGRTVPLQPGQHYIEHGLIGESGDVDHARAAERVRMISRDELDQILDHGLITDRDVLPRSDVEDELLPQYVAEERTPWEGPLDRAVMLVNRKVRSQQFRKRVLDAYAGRCALTGMKLINGGGRVETEAAHIMSVEAGGPDSVRNGIALSGTVHWMFDRGLISLSNNGDILLSRAINDRDGVERLIYRDRKARFPSAAAHRPHARYLQWHRTECFHD